MSAIELYEIGDCEACARARAMLESVGRPLRRRDIARDPLSWAEIKRLAALAGSIWHVICVQSTVFKALGIDRRGLPEPELLALMAAEPSLLRLPIVVVDGAALVGFQGTARGRPLPRSAPA